MSCQSITRNLVQSYASFLKIYDRKKVQIINFHKDISPSEIKKIILKINAFRPGKIIFLDHTPHPFPLLKAYSEAEPVEMPEIVIHVFGDFTLLTHLWVDTENYLKLFKVKWICASLSQCELLKKFIKDKASVFYSPFPINIEVFSFDQISRQRTRSELKLKNNEFVFLYTGRLSYQKRIPLLLNYFEAFLQQTSVPCKLLLAGNFDHLGNLYTGEHFLPGEFCQKLILYFSRLKKDTQERVHFLGHVSETDLNEIYSASDVYISLSTHNDEDYGMAPAEAVCTGLPAILTNWGGFSSFKQIANDVHLIPVAISLSQTSIDIDKMEFLKAASLVVNNRKELARRRQMNSQESSDVLSVKGVSVLLEEIFLSPSHAFQGFTSNLTKVAKSFKHSKPFINQSKYNSLYLKLYESYISKEL